MSDNKLDRGAAVGRGVSVGVVVAALLAGCKGDGGGASKPGPSYSSNTTQRIVLDGVTDEWPEAAAAIADADYFYFRIGLESEATLQASPDPLTLFVDADGNPATGQVLSYPRAASGFGFDLAVEFSAGGKPGVSVAALDSAGGRTPLTHAAIGLTSAPTYASTAFEVRMDRHLDAPGAPGLAAAMAEAGGAAAMVALQDTSGQIVGWSDPELFSKPRGAGGPARTDAPIPAKPAGAVRIVSWNIHKSAPLLNADPFARVFQALQPDIILAQEWDEADESTLVAWFTAAVSGQYAWQARMSAGPGVAIIAPFPITPVGPGRLTVEETGGDADPPVRWVAGLVQTPVGNLAVSSVHLKCCGSKGSPEDLQRMAEARVINAAMKSAYDEIGSPLRVIAGDLNLVGSLPPIHALIAGLDTDASDLEVADAFVLGDATQATWADPAREFTPGRLDYALVSGSTLEVVHAFVFDTARLSDAALARIGLDRTDTGASDHRPIVMDLRPR